MKNLTLTPRGEQVRAALETLSALLEESNHRNPLVETTKFGAEESFLNGWDLGGHHATMHTLKRAVLDALVMGLPVAQVAS